MEIIIMRKIIILCIALFLTFTSAYAEDKASHFEFEYSKGVESFGAAAFFDENNKLVAAAKCDVIIGDKICSTELEMPEGAKGVRLYFPGTQTMIKNFTTIDEPSKPDQEPDNKPDTNPDNPDKQPSDRYPTELDAATAFMFVKSAERAVDNGEEVTKLDVFFRGEETELLVSDDIKLKSAPIVHDDLTGASADVLEKGDVIYCSTNLSGNLRSIELIFRPESEDIITADTDYGNNFESLFSLGNTVTTVNPVSVATYGGNNNYKYQYAFGVIKDVKNTKYVTLCNKRGLADKDITIDLSADTVVYVYDKSARKKVYIGTVGDVEKSEIDKLDDDDNVLEWNPELTHNYALVRMRDGGALDIAVYRGY